MNNSDVHTVFVNYEESCVRITSYMKVLSSLDGKQSSTSVRLYDSFNLLSAALGEKLLHNRRRHSRTALNDVGKSDVDGPKRYQIGRAHV